MSGQWGIQVERIEDIWIERDDWLDQEEWRKQELLELWKLCNISAEIFEANKEKYTPEALSLGERHSSDTEYLSSDTEIEELKHTMELLKSGILWPVMVSGINPSKHNQHDLMRIRGIISNMRGIDIPFTEEEANEMLKEKGETV
jgi:hypothetical protein